MEGRELSPRSGRARGAETKERALNSPPRPRKPPPLGDADVATVRALAALFEIAAMCPEPPCKRSRACRAHGAPCLARFRDTYRDLVAELAAWPLLHEDDEEEEWWQEA